uniref:Uncharacterized protein n=1 Tax=Cacopsylla melanoneura TaxID=428564 RepID=A0A8D9AVP0_9HEMI
MKGIKSIITKIHQIFSGKHAMKVTMVFQMLGLIEYWNNNNNNNSCSLTLFWDSLFLKPWVCSVLCWLSCCCSVSLIFSSTLNSFNFVFQFLTFVYYYLFVSSVLVVTTILNSFNFVLLVFSC